MWTSALAVTVLTLPLYPRAVTVTISGAVAFAIAICHEMGARAASVDASPPPVTGTRFCSSSRPAASSVIATS